MGVTASTPAPPPPPPSSLAAVSAAAGTDRTMMAGVQTSSLTAPGSAHNPSSVSSGGPPSTAAPPTQDPLTPHLAADLPRHIVESRLLPGSGRMMRSYRLRSSDATGSVIVCRAMLVRYESTPTGVAAINKELKSYKDELRRIRDAIRLDTHPNVMPHLRFFLSPRDPMRDHRSGLTTVPVYLLRPHLHTTLSDRLATRPFLTTIEKTWIGYQLLRALDTMHKSGVCHGHVTCENVGLTSWNWVVLTDLAVYKKVRMADDDPSDFIQYFQEQEGGGTKHGGEKRCYLAPERFYTNHRRTRSSSGVEGEEEGKEEKGVGGLTPEMDIFGCGCVLIETFLNGERALDLGDLMEYRRQGSVVPSLQQKLNKIESSSMRAACRHMLNLDPTKRLAASEYLDRLSEKSSSSLLRRGSSSSTGGAEGGETQPKEQKMQQRQVVVTPPIPSSFGLVLHPLMTRMRSDVLTPDGRIAMCAAWYGGIVRETVGVVDGWGERYFERMLGATFCELEKGEEVAGDNVTTSLPSSTEKTPSTDAQKLGSSSSSEGPDPATAKTPKSTRPIMEGVVGGADSSNDALLAETEALLSKLDSMAWLTEEQDFADIVSQTDASSVVAPTSVDPAAPAATKKNASTTAPPSTDHSTASGVKSSASSSSLIVYVQLILSSLRHVHRPSSKLVALRLLVHLSKFSSDEARLQRIVPSVVSLLHDQDAMVRACAIKVLTETLSVIQTFPPSDSQLFPQYVFKRLAHLIADPSLVVRVAFAECIGLLAETSLRFLDISHAVRLYEAVGGGAAGGHDTPKSGGLTPPPPPTVHDPVAPDVFADDVARLLEGGTNTIGGAAAADVSVGGQGSKDESSTTPPTISATHSGLGGDATPPPPASNGTTNTTATMGTTAPLISNTYNVDLASLHETVSRWVVHITTDISEQSSPPKRALLLDLTRLCTFFGHEGVMAFLLPQLLAFLNDRQDWQLRAALCRHLPSICAVVGRAATEHFVLPCIETALVDGEGRVMRDALSCLGSLVDAGLLSRSKLLGTVGESSSSATGGAEEQQQQPPTRRKSSGRNRTSRGEKEDDGKGVGIIEKYAPLLLYPSADVRHGAVSLVHSCCRSVGFPDVDVFVIPILRPYLRFAPSRDHLKSADGIRSCLLPPLTKSMLQIEFDKITNLSNNPQEDETSVQWTSVRDVHVGMEGASSGGLSASPSMNDPMAKTSTLSRSDVNKADTEMASRLEQMRGYLRLLCRNRKLDNPSHNQSWSTKQMERTIEGNLKLSSSYYIPSQKFAELIMSPVPDWFVGLRDVSSKDMTLCSEICVLRSISAMTQVYGLTIMQPTNSMLPVGTAFDPVLDTAVNVSAEGGVTEKDAVSFLASPESKIFESASDGQWGSIAVLDPSQQDTSLLVTKFDCLRVPPLPPSLGVLREADGRPFSWHGPVAATSDTSLAFRSEWKPKVDALVASSSPASGHLGPVARMAVSQDQAFFVSASHDGTSKVWELRQTEGTAGNLESSLTYSGHQTDGSRARPRINDAGIVENSHSVVTGASDGSVHVWRIDLVSSNRQTGLAHGSKAEATTADSAASGKRYYETSRVSGSTLVRSVDPCEGEVLAVSHFNTPSASVVTFATQKGIVHSWDLRCAVEPFALTHRPELGYLTSMAVGSDRNWMVTGTSRGFLSLWDLRFPIMAKLWQHSSAAPVWRLATSFTTFPQDKDSRSGAGGGEARPLIFMGCGQNEASIFDVGDGQCRQCFRVLDPSLSYVDQSALPTPCVTMPSLDEVHIATRSLRRMQPADDVTRNTYIRSSPPEPSVHALVGRIGTNGHNYLITGGTDRHIRYWDFTSPSRCYTVSGLMNGQPRPSFESVGGGGGNNNNSRLLLCRQMPIPMLGEVESSRIPRKLHRGPVRSENHHGDAILDLKGVDFPVKGLLSCSRDGSIKMWR